MRILKANVSTAIAGILHILLILFSDFMYDLPRVFFFITNCFYIAFVFVCSALSKLFLFFIISSIAKLYYSLTIGTCCEG